MSSRLYLRTPARSAWPGRGRVTTLASPRSCGSGGHPLFPVFVVAVFNDEGDRAAHRAAEADAGDDAGLVLFDQHTAAAAVALLAAREVVVDARDIDLEAGGCAFDDGDEFGSVGFSGGEET